MGCGSSKSSPAKVKKGNVQRDIVSYFNGTPFAVRLSPDELREFASLFSVREFSNSSEVYMQDSPSGDFFIIIQGEVDITVDSSFLCRKKAGDYVGASTVERGARVDTATCRTDCRLLELTRDNLSSYLTAHPQMESLILSLMGYNASENIGQIDFFRGIKPKKLLLLGTLLKHVALRNGDILFKEGEIGNSLYILSEGSVQAVHYSEDGAALVLGEFKAGDVFGEIALIMSIPRTATIVAKEACLLLEIGRDSFQLFLKLLPGNLPLYDVMKLRTAEHLRKYKVPFFDSIPEDKYPVLASLCQVEEVAKGERIFSEGDPGNAFYIIAHGEMQVEVTKDGKALPLNRMGPGKYFGEIALVQDVARTATVTAVERCVLLKITKANFERFFQEAPEAIADFEIKLARYEVQLRSVLYHPLGLDMFTRHLALEFSEENILFWKECRDYRHLTFADVTSSAEDNGGSMGTGDGEMTESDIALCFYMLSYPRQIDTISVEDLARILEIMGVSCDDTEIQDVARAMNVIQNSITLPGFRNAILELRARRMHSREVSRIVNVRSREMRVYRSVDLEATNNHAEPESRTRGNGGSIGGGSIGGGSRRGSIGSPETHKGTAATPLLHKIIRSLQFIQLSKLKEIFSRVDTQGKGSFELKKFESVLQALDPRLKAQDLSDMDPGKTGLVNFSAFVSFMRKDKEQTAKFGAMLFTRAKRICNQYISENAPTQVNIKGPLREEITKKIDSGAVDSKLFDAAANEVLKLMSSDSFARFKQSPLFQEFLNLADTYKHCEIIEEEPPTPPSAPNSGRSGGGRISVTSPNPLLLPATGSTSNLKPIVGTGHRKSLQPVIRSGSFRDGGYERKKSTVYNTSLALAEKSPKR